MDDDYGTERKVDRCDMAKSITHGLTNPDERSVALVEWKRRADGTSFVSIDDYNRQYVYVSEQEAPKFEDAAEAQKWRVRLVGFCGFTERRVYALEYVPPPEFKALDMTNPADVRALNRAMKDRPKRFKTTNLRAKAEAATDLAFDIAIGEMKHADEGQTEEAKEAISRRRVKAAELAATLVRSTTTMEQINQADEHLADKNARLDEGLATENIGIQKTYRVDPSVEEQV